MILKVQTEKEVITLKHYPTFSIMCKTVSFAFEIKSLVRDQRTVILLRLTQIFSICYVR